MANFSVSNPSSGPMRDNEFNVLNGIVQKLGDFTEVRFSRFRETGDVVHDLSFNQPLSLIFAWGGQIMQLDPLSLTGPTDLLASEEIIIFPDASSCPVSISVLQ